MSPDIPHGFGSFLTRGCLPCQPAVPWSAFYSARIELLRRVEAMRAANAAVTRSEGQQPPTWADVASECGADAADALDVLRDAWERGRYPDDMCASFNAHRLTFARWLVIHHLLGETL